MQKILASQPTPPLTCPRRKKYQKEGLNSLYRFLTTMISNRGSPILKPHQILGGSTCCQPKAGLGSIDLTGIWIYNSSAAGNTSSRRHSVGEPTSTCSTGSSSSDQDSGRDKKVGLGSWICFFFWWAGFGVGVDVGLFVSFFLSFFLSFFHSFFNCWD